MLLAGEAGIGKTSLAAEVARRAHRDGWTVLFGRCDEEPGLTYQPFAEALRGFVSAATPEELPVVLARRPVGAGAARARPRGARARAPEAGAR